MATYQKLNDCPQTFTIIETNQAIDSSVLTVLKYDDLTIASTRAASLKDYSYQLDGIHLLGTRMPVYLGFEDTDGNFNGNNTGTVTLTSDTTGCSATATKKLALIGTDGYNTASSIKFTLNKCTADRTITFSYNSLPVFKIKQTYNTPVSSPSLLYAVYVYGLININSANDSFAWFAEGAPDSFVLSNINNYLSFTIDNFDNINKSYLVFWYTNNFYIFSTDLQVSKIINNLTHYSGNDNLSGYGSYYYITMNNTVNVYDNSKPTTKKISLLDTVYLYKISGITFTRVSTVCFGSTTETYHLGCYKIN